MLNGIRVIEHALASANPDRALRTMADIQGMIESEDGAAERLTPEVMEMLVNGVANARSD